MAKSVAKPKVKAEFKPGPVYVHGQKEAWNQLWQKLIVEAKVSGPK